MGPTHPGPSGHAGELQTYMEHVAPNVEHAVVQLLFTPEHCVTYVPLQGVTDTMVHL